MQKHESKVAAQINLIKLPLNTRYEFKLDQSLEWIKNILLEMNENASEKSPEVYLEETSLKISGEIEKKNKTEMSEFLVVQGLVEAEYVTECVRTLRPMKVKLNFSFKACFIDEELATTEMFADQDDTYVENEVYELYFYNKRLVNFQDMVHEQIFLNYNQYPVLDADCKLDGVESH